MNINNISRNSNDFSFVDRIGSFIMNNDFSEGYREFARATYQTKNTEIWNALSAIGGDYGSVIYSNVLNYLDNVSNVDLCKVKALDSMIKVLGIDFNAIGNIDDMPIEIVNLLDVMSVNKSYLLNSRVFSKQFMTELSTFDNGAISSCIDSLKIDSTLADEVTPTILDQSAFDEMSSYAGVSSYHEVSTILNDESYNVFLKTAFYNLLSSMVFMQYADAENGLSSTKKYIYQYLQQQLIDDAGSQTDRMDEYDERIQQQKIRYKLGKEFSPSKIVDDIENGYDSFDNYNVYEQKVLQIELERREAAYTYAKGLLPHESSLGFNLIRYSYYREKKVKKYFKYIEDVYNSFVQKSDIVNNVETDISSTISIYDKDEDYFNINQGTTKKLLSYDKISREVYLNTNYLDTVATLLANMTLELAEIREMIKVQIRKDYIKGTFLLLSYSINEYLKRVIANQYGNLFFDEDGMSLKKYIDDSVLKGGNVELIEYVDSTEYFNVKNDKDIHHADDMLNYSNLNPKFWDNDEAKLGEITQDLPLDEIEDFYREQLKLKNRSVDNLVDFLSAVFESGTPSSFLKDNESRDFTCILTNGESASSIEEIQSRSYSELEKQQFIKEYNDKKTEFLQYGGNAVGVDPYFNHKNITHSTYQIHPYLYNFVEKSNLAYPLANTFYEIFTEDYEKELVEVGLDNIIGKYGNVINLWKYDLQDWTGYESKYEHDLNLLDTNQLLVKGFQGYTGLFYPPALEEYLTNTEEFIQNVQDDTANSAYKHLNLTPVEINKTVSQLKTYESQVRTIAQAQKGSSSWEHTKRNEFDIYKYAEDAYGNQLFLLKSYAYLYDLHRDDPTYEPDFFEKRNSPGELWMRIKGHPIAFPAFDLNSANVNFRMYKLEDVEQTPTLVYHEYIRTLNDFFSKTISRMPELGTYGPCDITRDTLGSNLRVFYDMEMEPSNRGILLNVSYQTGSLHDSEKINDPSKVDLKTMTYFNSSVIVAALEQEFDFANQEHVYYFKSDDKDNIDNITNPTNGSLIQSQQMSDGTGSARVVECRDETYDFIGFSRTSTYTFGVYVSRYHSTDLRRNDPTQIRSFRDPNTNHDQTPYLYVAYEGYKYGTKLTKGHANVALPFDILYDDKNPNATNITIATSEKTMTIAFASEHIQKKLDYSDNVSKVVNFIEYSAMVEDKKDVETYGTNTSYPRDTALLQTTDSQHINIYNSFDTFTSHLIAVSFRFNHNKFIYDQYKVYNVNSDLGFMPVFNDRTGTSRIYNNKSLKQDIYNLELLGPEQADVTFTPVIIDPADEKYGRVTEDYREYNKFFDYSPELSILPSQMQTSYEFELSTMFGEAWFDLIETNDLMKYKYLMFNTNYPSLPLCKGSLSTTFPEKSYYMSSEVYDLLSGPEIIGPNGVTFQGVNMTNHINNISAVDLCVNFDNDTALPYSAVVTFKAIKPLMTTQVIKLSTLELMVYCKNNVKSYDAYHIIENANSGSEFEKVNKSQLSTINFAEISALSSYILSGEGFEPFKPFESKNPGAAPADLSADLEFKYSEDETINREFPYLDAQDIEDEITVVENDSQYIYFVGLDGFDDVDKSIFSYKVYDPIDKKMVTTKVNTTSGKYKQFYLSSLMLETTYNVENIGTDTDIQYGIVLYVNYKNFTNPQYIEGTSWENYRVAPSTSDNIKGTYLRLLPGKSGSIDIRMDFINYAKINDTDIGQSIVGKETKIIATYYVMNVSDDKPKFLISRKPFAAAKSNANYDDSYLKQLSSIGDTYVYRGNSESHKRVYGTLTPEIVETI